MRRAAVKPNGRVITAATLGEAVKRPQLDRVLMPMPPGIRRPAGRRLGGIIGMNVLKQLKSIVAPDAGNALFPPLSR